MSDLTVALAPVGRMDGSEVEEAALRVAKVIHRAVELKEPLGHPKSAEDVARGQFGAPAILAAGCSALPSLKVGKRVGGEAGAPVSPAARPDATVFVTDLDLFAPSRDSVLGDVDAPHRVAIVSVRRLRESFYRRKPDPAKHRARLTKEVLRAIGRVRGLPDCRDPGCAMAPSLAVSDIDRKGERYCASCWKRLSTGAMRI